MGFVAQKIYIQFAQAITCGVLVKHCAWSAPGGEPLAFTTMMYIIMKSFCPPSHEDISHCANESNLVKRHSYFHIQVELLEPYVH